MHLHKNPRREFLLRKMLHNVPLNFGISVRALIHVFQYEKPILHHQTVTKIAFCTVTRQLFKFEMTAKYGTKLNILQVGLAPLSETPWLSDIVVMLATRTSDTSLYSKSFRDQVCAEGLFFKRKSRWDWRTDDDSSHA